MTTLALAAIGLFSGYLDAKTPWNDIDGMFRRKDWTGYMALFAPHYKRVALDGKTMSRERHYEAFGKLIVNAHRVDVVSKPGRRTRHPDGAIFVTFDRRVRLLTSDGKMIVTEHAGTHTWESDYGGDYRIVMTVDTRFKWTDYGVLKQYWPRWP